MPLRRNWVFRSAPKLPSGKFLPRTRKAILAYTLVNKAFNNGTISEASRSTLKTSIRNFLLKHKRSGILDLEIFDQEKRHAVQLEIRDRMVTVTVNKIRADLQVRLFTAPRKRTAYKMSPVQQAFYAREVLEDASKKREISKACKEYFDSCIERFLQKPRKRAYFHFLDRENRNRVRLDVEENLVSVFVIPAKKQ